MQLAEQKQQESEAGKTADYRSLVSKLIEVIQMSQALINSEALSIVSGSCSSVEEEVFYIEDLAATDRTDASLFDCYLLLNDALLRLLSEHR